MGLSPFAYFSELVRHIFPGICQDRLGHAAVTLEKSQWHNTQRTCLTPLLIYQISPHCYCHLKHFSAITEENRKYGKLGTSSSSFWVEVTHVYLHFVTKATHMATSDTKGVGMCTTTTDPREDLEISWTALVATVGSPIVCLCTLEIHPKDHQELICNWFCQHLSVWQPGNQ